MTPTATPLWSCPDCAFSFDAMHTDADGSHSCPACAEMRLRAESERLQSALAEATARAAQEAQIARGALHLVEVNQRLAETTMAERDLLTKQLAETERQRDACAAAEIAARDAVSLAVSELEHGIDYPHVRNERERLALLHDAAASAAVRLTKVLAAPSPSAEVMAARLAEAREEALETMRSAIPDIVTGEGGRLSRATLKDIAEHAHAMAASSLALSPHPAPAPTVAPSAKPSGGGR